MALPKQTTPIYTLTIPSTNKKIKFRPFLVKEETALLIAQQSEDVAVMIDTLKSIITSCVQDKIDIDKLAIFDYEYIFLQIRAKSVGEFADIVFTCQHCENENNTVNMNIDITKIPVIKDPSHSTTIPLFDDVGVIMRYPSLETLQKSEKHLDDINMVLSVVIDCIESIYDTNEVYSVSDITREELEEFVMNLTKEQFDKIEKFFSTVPRFEQTVAFVCPACKAKNEQVIRGAENFF